jgi:hypothetical protein
MKVRKLTPLPLLCVCVCVCLITTSASAVLDSSADPRAQYIKWYRAGQVRIAEEALHALNAAILEQDQYDEEGSVE